MSNKYKVILGCTAALMALMLLFPPWIQRVDASGTRFNPEVEKMERYAVHKVLARGYFCVLDPPETKGQGYWSIDVLRLSVQVVCVLMLVAVVICFVPIVIARLGRNVRAPK